MEEMNGRYPFKRPGLMVSQPFGDFFVTTIPARILLDVAYSDRLTADRQPDGSYKLGGSQRPVAERRLKEIGKFINSLSASFPNSIILAANYRADDGLIEEEESRKWSLSAEDDGLTGILSIPTDAKLAPIIDGQHRLFGFNYATHGSLDMPLLCALFFDLPKPYQAFLFATINANQRPVNKSLTYELFGYNVEDENPEKWTPEKLAVFLTRKLGTDSESPFRDHIIIAAENDFAPRMAQVRRERGWAVSTATVVEGIVNLISRNPKQDANKLGGNLTYQGKDRSTLLDEAPDSRPLRRLYISKSDDIIYTGVKNFFAAANKTLWTDPNPDSLIRKTVGIQALFDLARIVTGEMVPQKDFRVGRFEERLQPASRLDFADRFFQTSGTGRQRIRNCLELCLRLKTLADITSDLDDYRRLCDL
jgi:DNA phosphorothioation-associated DGQHR protein 1